jgi:hypothetical protein
MGQVDSAIPQHHVAREVHQRVVVDTIYARVVYCTYLSVFRQSPVGHEPLQAKFSALNEHRALKSAFCTRPGPSQQTVSIEEHVSVNLNMFESHVVLFRLAAHQGLSRD